MSCSKNRSLSLESLEDRKLLAASITGGVLTITGSNANDIVQVLENHETETVTIIDNGQVSTVDSDDFDELRVHLNSGNNSFTYRVVGDEFDHERKFDIWSSDGFDYITLDFRGSQAVIESDIDISINTGALSDQVGIYLPEMDDVDVDIFANLGSGNDGMSVLQVGDMIDNANLNADIYGSSGNDNLTYNANYDVDMDTLADLNVNMYGNSGDDSLSFYYRGEMDGDIRLNQYGQAGNDSLYSSATFDYDSDGRAWLRQYGGDGSDTLRNYSYDNSGAAGSLWWQRVRDWR